MKRFFFTLFFNFFLLIAFAQDSTSDCSLKISLLTAAPGAELYSTFGHTAIRVTDPTTAQDLVFNYGSFEFSDDFYIKFIRGKLLYYLSVENMEDFLFQYKMEKRSIQEQELKISCDAKKKLFAALIENSKDQNKYYRYDFLFDNCTTRAKDMIAKYAGDQVHFKNILPPVHPSFRDLLHSYLDAGAQPWSKLGIDILLGAKLDRKISNEESMFLPDYLLTGIDSAVILSEPIATKPAEILTVNSEIGQSPLISPFTLFSFIFLVMVVLMFVKTKWAKTVLRIFDITIFLLLGLAGWLLIFMWLGTDHIVCRNNYNLLWAWPTHLLAVFFIGRNTSWLPVYCRINFVVLFLLLVSWYWLPQELNKDLIPFILLITLRSWQLSKRKIDAEKKNQYSG